jgi:F0F1-type ATP synthase membrane subunit b/b'
MDKLGLNLNSFLFQLINFAIVFVILGKLVYPKFLQMLDERRKKIQEGIEKTSAVEVELAGIEDTKKQEIIYS